MDIIFKSRFRKVVMGEDIKCPKCDNKMVDMQLSNNKLLDRGIKMIMKEIGVDYETANKLLKKYGSVRNVVDNYNG